MRYPLMLSISMLSAILASAAEPAGPWVTFRYDATHVLFYLGEMRDPAKFTQEEVELQQVKQPLASWGGGGYLIRPTPDRLASFQPSSNTSLPEIHRGDRVSILLNGETTVTGIVDDFLEQWGGSNPIVQIGVLARVNSNQLRAFRVAKSNYFLAFLGPQSLAPATSAPRLGIIGRRQVLNHFGRSGELVLANGDAGWEIRLWRVIDARLVPTGVSYAYGD